MFSTKLVRCQERVAHNGGWAVSEGVLRCGRRRRPQVFVVFLSGFAAAAMPQQRAIDQLEWHIRDEKDECGERAYAIH